jgi:putative hydrolase of the HAD superfamily
MAWAPIRGVLFDAGNTLLRVRGSVGGVYAEVARRHGVTVGEESLEGEFRRAFRGRKESFLHEVARPHSPERERAWWRELVRDVFGATGSLAAFGDRFDTFFDELYRTFEKPGRWQIFPDVIPCLDVLAGRGVPAAVVSNWDSRLHPVLAGLGLADRFRFVLTSAEFGAEKPDPAIFREGAARLGLEPDEVLHVGDLVRDDWLGALQAGLQAALVDRDGTCPPGPLCIADLGAVAGLLPG